MGLVLKTQYPKLADQIRRHACICTSLVPPWSMEIPLWVGHRRTRYTCRDDMHSGHCAPPLQILHWSALRTSTRVDENDTLPSFPRF